MAKYTLEIKSKQLEKEFKKLKKFCKYIRRVFKFESIINNQKDSRKKRTYQTSMIFIILFWASIFRVQSFNRLEEMLKYGCFKPLFPPKFKMPSIDTISEILEKWDLESLQESFLRIINTLYSNKNFKNGTIDGFTVCAIDGTDVIRTKKRKCYNCMCMRNSEGYYYGHKSVIAMVIGREINYVINTVFLNVKEEITEIDKETYENKVVTKSEGELFGGMKLLPQLPYWIDIIVADALYFKAPFFKEVIKNSKHAVIRLKDKTTNSYNAINYNAICKSAVDSFTHEVDNKKHTVTYWFKDYELVDSTLLKNEPGKLTPIRLYKFVEVVESTIKGEEKFIFREIYIGTSDKNLEAKTIWKIIHYRWYIENTCFHQLKTYCHMEHCFNHDHTAIQVIITIMFMAFNIFRSFMFRNMKKFREDFQKNKATISWLLTEMLIELTNLLLLLRLEIILINPIPYYDLE